TQPVEDKIYTHQYPQLAEDKIYRDVLRVYSGTSCYKETNPVNVTVRGVPSLFFNLAQSICMNSEPFKLDAGNQNMVLGTEKTEGKGLVNGIFYPELAGVGKHEITYTFLSNSGCTDTIKRMLQVVDIPELKEYKEFDV